MKKLKKKIYHYETVFEPNGAGYTVTVPKLPGLVTEGDNLKEAREMARDAIRCYLEALLKEKALPLSRADHNEILLALGSPPCTKNLLHSRLRSTNIS
jgi:predicted RNase H-like HicB family nuclease